MPTLPVQPRTILHIGPPKTGTTTLQEQVFPALGSVCFMGKPWWNPRVPYDKCVSFHRAVDSVTKASAKDFDADAARDALRDWLDHAPAAAPQPDGTYLPRLLSEERLAFSDVVNLEQISARLSGLFPDAEIVYVRRDPVSGLRSFYRWLYARAWIDSSFSDWLSRGLDGSEEGYAAVALRSYDWDLIQRSFGAHFSVVRSLEFRDMLDSPAEFLSQLIGQDAEQLTAFNWLKERPLNVSRGRPASELHRLVKKAIRQWNRLPVPKLDEKAEYIGDTPLWNRLERVAAILPLNEAKLSPTDADRQRIHDYYRARRREPQEMSQPAGQRAQP